MLVKFENKNILVTGSSKGIGLGICKQLLKENNRVIITGSKQTNINSAKKILGEKNVYYFCGDLTNIKNIEKLLNFTKKTFSNLDLLVCNLGSGQYKYLDQFNSDEWQRVFNINFWSTFNTINKSIKLLGSGKGSIVCISSIVSSYNIIEAPLAYSTAKGMLNRYVNGLTPYLSKKGIRINIISPGNVLFSKSIWEKKLKADKNKTLKYIKNKVPLNKFAEIDDISSMVIYLASDKAKFITGSEFIIDGGQTKL